MAEIHRQKPDIICFQKLLFGNLKKNRLDSLYGPCAELDGRDVEVHRYKFYSNFTMRNFKRYHCEGTIDTSDFDSLEMKEYDLMRKQISVMSAEFEFQPDKWVTIFFVHLRSSAYSTPRRFMKEKSHWWDGVPFYLRNYKIGKRICDSHARNVRRFIDEARAEGKIVILTGDLNDLVVSH